MFGMSNDQITAQIRQLLPALGALAVALGWIAPDVAGQLVTNILAAIGPLMILGGMAWASYANTEKALLESAAQIIDPLTNKPALIVTSVELAAATPGFNNIVSTSDVKVQKK